jgi:hypothetical protein
MYLYFFIFSRLLYIVTIMPKNYGSKVDVATGVVASQRMRSSSDV